MSFLVWLRDEFVDADDDERADRAWKVPDERGIFDPSYPCTDAEQAAERFAEHFHDQRDGWESSWPLEFVVFDGSSYFVVEVERETVPEFRASKPKPLSVNAAA